MCGLAVTAAFEKVEEGGEIGIEIGIRVFQRVAHASLRRKVHDRSEVTVLEQSLGPLSIGEVKPMKGEIRKLPKDGEPRLFKGRIIIGIDIVHANNCAAILEEPAREAKSDKACRAGD